VAVFLWAARHDRPVAWAGDEGNGDGTRLRPRRLPSPATLSRRLDGDGVGLCWRCLQERLDGAGDGLPALVAVLDGTPLTVSRLVGPPAAGGRGGHADEHLRAGGDAAADPATELRRLSLGRR